MHDFICVCLCIFALSASTVVLRMWCLATGTISYIVYDVVTKNLMVSNLELLKLFPCWVINFVLRGNVSSSLSHSFLYLLLSHTQTRASALSIFFILSFSLTHSAALSLSLTLTRSLFIYLSVYLSMHLSISIFLLSETAVDTARFSDSFLGWLEQDLQAVDRTQLPFVIAFFHRPMYCSNDGEPLVQ